MGLIADHTPPEATQDVNTYENKLKEAGMPDQRAAVYARSTHGVQNSTIAAEFDISPPVVTEHINKAEEQITECKELASLTTQPQYVTFLSEDVTETVFDSSALEGYVGFSIHNPTDHDTDKQYKLGEGGVVEGYYMRDADTFLLIHHQQRMNRGTKTGMFVEPSDLTRFLVDWVFADRLDAITSDANSNEWFITGENREPEWLEQELGEFGIEIVEATTDDRFINPITDGDVYCSSGAKSGRYRSGHKITYQPTDEEIAELLDAGEVTEEEAETATRKQPEELRKLMC